MVEKKELTKKNGNMGESQQQQQQYRQWQYETTMLYVNLGCHRRAREPISNFTPFNCYLSEIERESEFCVEMEEHKTKLYACSLEKFYLSFVQYNRITIHLEKIHVENFSVHK